MSALLRVIAEAVNKPPHSILQFSKIAEGGSYRVFEAVFDDGLAVIAQLPYPCTIPPVFGIASEVATMHFLQLHGIPVPQIFAWNSSAVNPVESEYVIMAKVQGKELDHTWYTMTLQERISMMESIVNLEKKLFQIQSPANGSIYHTTFLEPQEGIFKVPIETPGTNTDRYSIGPSTEYMWWYRNRDKVAVNGGPCASPEIIVLCLRTLTRIRDTTQRRDGVGR